MPEPTNLWRSLMSDYPSTCPEGAITVTKPISVVSIDLDAKEFTLVFGEGESIKVPVRDVPHALLKHFEATAYLAAYLAENQLIWADPALVEAGLAAAEGV